MPRITSEIYNAYMKDLLAMASALEDKHRIKLVRKSGSLEGATAKAGMVLMSLDEVNPWNTSEARAFLLNAETLGLAPEDLGAVFIFRDKRYKLVGFRPNAPKRCILLHDDQGREIVADRSVLHYIRNCRVPPESAAA